MQAYRFEREFSADGEIVSAPGSRHVTRAEAEAMVAEARQQGADSAQAEIARLLAEITAHLRPVRPVLSEVCVQLRREAVELALAAARSMIGSVLSTRGAELAAAAIGQQAQQLRSSDPHIEVWVAEAQLEAVTEQLLISGVSSEGFRFCSDAGMKPGDWRLHWDEGGVDFDTEEALAQLTETMRCCLEHPADLQDDLFADRIGD